MLTRLRRELEETYGIDAAAYLMDRPQGGWDALATKVDLERFATKQDLERFATKQDLERFATKQDLERFATKEDLAATRAELAHLRTELHQELRAQTWTLAKLVAGAQGVVVAAIAAIGIVLRFA